MKVLLVVLALVLVGCEDDKTPTKRSEARAETFRVCMELAAKMPRQADDDVADIVEACSSSSYYMTNYIGW